MRKHACRKPYVFLSHLFCYFGVNPRVVRTVCRSTADSLDRYFHTSLSLATSSAAAAAQKKHERTQQLTSQKYARAPFLMPVAVEDCTKKIFCASCCVYVKNKCVSCYYSGIVRRHYTKPESLPVRSTFSFFFSPTVIRDPSCFDEFCLMRATPPVRLR